MAYVKPDVIHYSNAVDGPFAVRFLRKHLLPMVRVTPNREVEAWCECIGPGGEFVERTVFEPDTLGLFDMDEIEAWLGY
jgi:hypothetical protein